MKECWRWKIQGKLQNINATVLKVTILCYLRIRIYRCNIWKNRASKHNHTLLRVLLSKISKTEDISTLISTLEKSPSYYYYCLITLRLLLHTFRKRRKTINNVGQLILNFCQNDYERYLNFLNCLEILNFTASSKFLNPLLVQKQASTPHIHTRTQPTNSHPTSPHTPYHSLPHTQTKLKQGNYSSRSVRSGKIKGRHWPCNVVYVSNFNLSHQKLIQM